MTLVFKEAGQLTWGRYTHSFKNRHALPAKLSFPAKLRAGVLTELIKVNDSNWLITDKHIYIKIQMQISIFKFKISVLYDKKRYRYLLFKHRLLYFNYMYIGICIYLYFEYGHLHFKYRYKFFPHTIVFYICLRVQSFVEIILLL